MMIMFLSQITSCDGDMLVKWHNSNTPPLAPACKITPTWYKYLSRVVLQSPLTSQRLLPRYCTPLKLMTATPLLPDLQRVRKSEWVAIYNDTLNSTIIGRICFKNPINNSVLVEHWLHFIDNVVESPSYAKPLVSRCPGCSLHISSYANVKKSKRKYRYSYIASYNALTAICFVNIVKRGDNYLLRPSLIELQQKATNNMISSML